MPYRMLGSKRVARSLLGPAEQSAGAGKERRAAPRREMIVEEEADERKEQTLGGTLFERLGGEELRSPGSAFLRLFYDGRHCQRRIFITVTAIVRLFTCRQPMLFLPVKGKNR